MDRIQLQRNINYLISKYAPERLELKELIKEDIGSVKYILAEIDMCGKQEYEDKDIELIQDIVFYYV